MKRLKKIPLNEFQLNVLLSDEEKSDCRTFILLHRSLQTAAPYIHTPVL